MRRGVPIRDVSVDPVTGALQNNTGFLRTERNILTNHDWVLRSEVGVLVPAGVMTMDHPPQAAAGPAREQLGFLPAARARFEFLLELGFREVVAEPIYLRLERDDMFVEVFHGRASYELGVEFGRWVRVDDDVVEQKFHLIDVLPVLTPGVRFVARTATSQEQVARFVDELASTARLAADHLQRGGADAFDRISDAVAARSEEYLDGLRADRLRARAEDAWHRKDFASVIAAYEEIDSELETVELREERPSSGRCRSWCPRGPWWSRRR